MDAHIVGDVDYGTPDYEYLSTGGIPWPQKIDAAAAANFEGNLCPPLDPTCYYCYDFLSGAFGLCCTPKTHAFLHGWVL